MSLPVKLGVSTLALGSTVGVGYGAVNYFSQENKEQSINEPQTTSVKDLINKKYEYILLDTSLTDSNKDSKHWAEIWQSYQSKTGNEANPLQLEGWATRNSDNFTNKIKEKCSLLANSMILDEEAPDYKDVTKYCARGVTLADEATKSGLTVIKNNDNLDATTWNEKLGQKTNLKQHFDKLGLTSEGLTAENVRTKCKEIESKKKQDSDYKETLPAYKEVCANPKGK